jgi:hypothetical protein
MAFIIPWGPDLDFLSGEFEPESVAALTAALDTLPWLLKERVIRCLWACRRVDLTCIGHDALHDAYALIVELNKIACDVGRQNERLQAEVEIVRAMLALRDTSTPPENVSSRRPVLGPVALRERGLELSWMKKWWIEPRPDSPAYTTAREAIQRGGADLVIEYVDGTHDTFVGEPAELLLSHLLDRADSTLWHFGAEVAFPTPAERAMQAWMALQRSGQPITDAQLVRMVEQCILGALRDDERRRLLLAQEPP